MYVTAIAMWVYSITEKISTLSVTLSDAHVFVEDALTRDVVDNNYSDAITVEPSESINDTLYKAFFF